MEKKKLFILILILIIILFLIGIIIYPIFYASSNDDSEKNIDLTKTSDTMQQIDVLSNLSFFKILVEDSNTNGESIYSEKFVTIRDTESIEELQKMISTATPLVIEEATGYQTPTTALCYLDDDTMYNFFVVEKNIVVFSDEDYNKTIYKLDEQYDLDKFLTTLYNINVNASKYSISSKNGKYGVKYKSQTIVKEIYDDVVIINPNVDVFAVTTNGITTFIDKDSKNPFPNFEIVELLPSTTNNKYENAIKFKENGKYGLATLDGQILLSADYDNIEPSSTEPNCIALINGEIQNLIKLTSNGFEDIS